MSKADDERAAAADEQRRAANPVTPPDVRPDPATPSQEEVQANPQTWAPTASHTIVHAAGSAPQTDPLDESSPAVERTAPPSEQFFTPDADQAAADRAAADKAAADQSDK